MKISFHTVIIQNESHFISVHVWDYGFIERWITDDSMSLSDD